MKKERLYRVAFIQGEQEFHLHARYISEDSLMGFVELEDLVFQCEQSGVVVDTAEEKIKQKFKGVHSTYLPVHTVLRIDVIDDPQPIVARSPAGAQSKITSIATK